jgi:hypothetical protein
MKSVIKYYSRLFLLETLGIGKSNLLSRFSKPTIGVEFAHHGSDIEHCRPRKASICISMF